MAFERVAALEDFEIGATMQVELDEPICLVRLDAETVKAVHDVCSHEEYPLHEGYLDLASNDIECALHGSMFNLDTGDPDALPATRPIPVYACKVEDGHVWVNLDDQLNDAPLPRH